MKNSLEKIFAHAGALDQRSAGMIIKALESNNLDGFDYLEFKRSLSGLAQLPMDESTQFQSAFVTASTLGLTKQKLVETAEFYKKVVKKEKEKFDQAAQNQFERGIASKKGQVVKLEQAVNARKEQIRKMQADIEKHQQQIEKLRDDLCGAEEKIEAAKQSFENAYMQITNHIDEDINKIKTYIG